jgi:outer membrane autotransporter protein
LFGAINVTITNDVTGGEGGAGGAGNGGEGGDGGSGGLGILFASTTAQAIISAAVTGGDGGTSPGGAVGAGGDGINLYSDSSMLITGTGTVSGGLSGDGVRGNAMHFFGGNSTLTLYSGATIVGNVIGVGGQTLRLSGVDDGTFDASALGASAQLQVFSTLEKTDNTKWTLTGTSTYAGTTEVQAGTMALNANMASSAFTVSSGATLMGTGQTGALTLDSTAIHAPGNSIGTQTVNGNYLLNSGAILQIEPDDAGASDKVVVVGGTVSLTGAVLQVMAVPGTYSRSTLYRIIDNQGSSGVTGAFAQITSSLAFLTPSVIYNGGDGNDVVLTLINSLLPPGPGPSPTPTLTFCSVATSTNQCAVGNAVQKLGEGNPLYDAILVQSVAGAQQAFNALSGEVHATVSSVLANDSHYVRDILLGRLAQAYYGRVGNGAAVAGLAAGGPTAVAGLNGAPLMGLGMGEGAGDDQGLAVTSPITFWAQGYGAWADFNGNGNAAGANRTLGGFMSGMDAMLNDTWRIGGAIGYAQSDVGVGDRLSSADVESYQLAGYTSGQVGSFIVRGGGVWSWSSIDTDRAVLFPGFFEDVEASYNANTGQVFGEVALPLAHSNVAYEPFAGLAWVGVDSGSFTETGGDAALTSGGANGSVGYMSLGLRAAGSMFVGGVEVVPRASAAWLHAFGDVDPDQGLAFATFGQSFIVSGVPLAQDSALIDAGFDMVLGPYATAGLFYTGQFGDNVQDNAVSGRVNWQF